MSVSVFVIVIVFLSLAGILVFVSFISAAGVLTLALVAIIILAIIVYRFVRNNSPGKPSILIRFVCLYVT